MPAGTSLLNWNWAANHVQSELVNGEYVSAEATLILAGPARLEYMLQPGANIDAVKSYLYPIGLVQNFFFGQNRNLTRLFEIGSKRCYFVSGRTTASFQINRVLFFGPSLLRLLYAIAPWKMGNFGGNPFYFETEGSPTLESAGLQTPPRYEALFPKDLLLTPGYGGEAAKVDNRDFFINLASDLFQIPFGMGVIYKDAKNRPYGAVYLQDCLLDAHNFGVDANNVVLAESATGQFDMVAPMQLVTKTTQKLT